MSHQKDEKFRSLHQIIFHFLFFSFLKPSVFELVRSPDFANLPLIVEDFVKDNGGSYTGKFAEFIFIVL